MATMLKLCRKSQGSSEELNMKHSQIWINNPAFYGCHVLKIVIAMDKI
jgi:hypothetical protein